MKTLHELFAYELKDLYSSANYLLQVLKRMSSLATNRDLIEILDTYYFQAQYQQQELKNYFTKSSDNLRKTDCLIMSKLRDHALESMRYEGSREIRDVALILSLNMLKHFEATVFDTLLFHASRLKLDEMIDILSSLKIKIADDLQRPIEIASSLLAKRDSEELKDEAAELLRNILESQIADENLLLVSLPVIIQEAKFSNLREALETYQEEHQACLKRLNSSLIQLKKPTKTLEWEVMNGFISEWETLIKPISSRSLTDIGIIMTIQRIQYQNIAIYELEALLTKYIGNTEMHNSFQKLIDKERGNDQSFTAIAEGSLFEKGLDSKIQL